MKGAARLVLKIAVSAALVAFLVRSSDGEALRERLLGVRIASLAAFAAAMTALMLLPAVRWAIVLRSMGGKLSAAFAYRLVIIGNFFAQVMPLLGADVARVWYARHFGVPWALAIDSVVIDRLAALAALLLLVAFSLPWLFATVPGWFTWLSVLVLVSGLLGGVAFFSVLARLPEHWKLVAAARRFARSCAKLARAPRLAAQVLALSLVVHLAIALFVFALARTFGVPVGLGASVLLVPLVMLVSLAIPFTVGGWGVREGAMVVAFGFLNVAREDALLVSILFGLATALASSPGLVLWLAIRGRPSQAQA